MTPDEKAIRERWPRGLRMMAMGEELLAQIPPTRGFIQVAQCDPETAKYLAHAPDDIATLLGIIDGLRERNARLARALRAALATWCPNDPGGDGADGETYRLALAELDGEGR